MTDEHEQQRNRLREMRDAYLNVFGKEGERTIYQQRVLDDISRMANYHDTAMRFDNTGRFDGAHSAYHMGRQDVVKRIHLRLTWRDNHEHSSSDPESPELGADSA